MSRDDQAGEPIAPTLAPGASFAGCVIEAIAGRGGMGVVYRARERRPARTVALKVIAAELASDADFLARFERESEIAATIEHPNVLPVHRIGEEGGLLYIVMRYVEGTDLAKEIAGRGRLDPRRAIDVIGQVCAALSAAHARGLVHRDVKPANVLITVDGHVYLTDFGIAKRHDATGLTTQAGYFIGTLDYAAPEQIEGRPVDARTDVYATGCMLYQALAGRVPFARDNIAATIWAHLSDEVPSLRDVGVTLPAELDAVIARAMAKDPNDRYPSASDLGRAAASAFDVASATTASPSIPIGAAADSEDTVSIGAETLGAAVASAAHHVERGEATTEPRPVTRHLALLLILAVLVLGVGGAAAWALTRRYSGSASARAAVKTTPTSSAIASSGPAGLPAVTQPVLSSSPVTLHAYHVHLDAAAEPGFQRFWVLVDSASPTISVRVGANLGPSSKLRMCPIRDAHPAPPGPRCTIVTTGEAITVPHAPEFTGVSLVQEPGALPSSIDLQDVAVTYLATDRSVTLGLPSLAPQPGASACKDNACNPFFEVEPRRAGTFAATVTWDSNATAGLDMETGQIAEHSYSATGSPYNAVASRERSSTGGIGHLRIGGSLDGTLEAALAVRNEGARVVHRPVLSVTWP